MEFELDSEVGSGTILMTTSSICSVYVPLYLIATGSGDLNAATIPSKISITDPLSLALSSTLRKPPNFGVSRSVIANITSTAHALSATATAPSQIMPGTVTQSLVNSGTSNASSSLIVGLGVRPDAARSSVFLWVAVIGIFGGFF